MSTKYRFHVAPFVFHFIIYFSLSLSLFFFFFFLESPLYTLLIMVCHKFFIFLIKLYLFYKENKYNTWHAIIGRVNCNTKQRNSIPIEWCYGYIKMHNFVSCEWWKCVSTWPTITHPLITTHHMASYGIKLCFFMYS